MKNILIKSIYLITIAVNITCTGNPVISELYNNRITTILKGTYESNSPYSWTAVNSGDVFKNDTLVTNYANPVEPTVALKNSDLKFYMDIAAIRLGGENGKPSSTSDIDYYEYFAEDRQVYCSDNADTVGRDLLSCKSNSGVQKLTNFFDDGVVYPSTDVPSGTYKHIALWFRKLVISPAILYGDNAGNSPVTQTALFDNRNIEGYDLNTEIIQYAQSDTGKSTALTFPLQNTNLNIVVKNSDKPYVLEVRIFLKNVLMHHVIADGDKSNTDSTPLTLVSPSDWSADHTYNDAYSFQIGGNLLMTARIYEPSNVGSIDITAEANALPTDATYFIAIPNGTTFDPLTDGLPLTATSISRPAADLVGTISNLTPGSYDIYKTCDVQYQTGGALAAGNDGHPDTISANCGTAVVTSGNATAINIVGCDAVNCPL